MATAPGFAAGIAATVAIGLAIALWCPRSSRPIVPGEPFNWRVQDLGGTVIEMAGPSVGVAWSLLALQGRCRRRLVPSWADRAGRWLGACWIVLWCLVCLPESPLPDR